MSKAIAPSIKETAFSCPHCGAFTTQFWFQLYAEAYTEKSPTPTIPPREFRQRLMTDETIPEEARTAMLSWCEGMVSGLVFLEKEKNSRYPDESVHNLYLSRCYNCKKIAVWVHDRLMFPSLKTAAEPNTDLPDDVRVDFEEAREIVNASPRGAAALLRLCIQKLCKHLGEKGKRIDDDIADLVSKGLSPLVQRSLDIVRVIGNEAVHPGILDLKDDPDTASRLFELVNAIADQMITHPKTVNALYAKLPPDKRKAIEERDKKAAIQ